MTTLTGTGALDFTIADIDASPYATTHRLSSATVLYFFLNFFLFFLHALWASIDGIDFLLSKFTDDNVRNIAEGYCWNTCALFSLDIYILY